MGIYLEYTNICYSFGRCEALGDLLNLSDPQFLDLSRGVLRTERDSICEVPAVSWSRRHWCVGTLLHTSLQF